MHNGLPPVMLTRYSRRDPARPRADPRATDIARVPPPRFIVQTTKTRMLSDGDRIETEERTLGKLIAIQGGWSLEIAYHPVDFASSSFFFCKHQTRDIKWFDDEIILRIFVNLNNLYINKFKIFKIFIHQY